MILLRLPIVYFDGPKITIVSFDDEFRKSEIESCEIECTTDSLAQANLLQVAVVRYHFSSEQSSVVKRYATCTATSLDLKTSSEPLA